MPRELNLLPPSRRHYIDRQLVVDAVSKLLATLIAAWTIAIVAGAIAIGVLGFLITTTSSGVAGTLTQKVKTYQDLRTQIGAQNTTIKTMQTLTQQRVVWSDLLPDLFNALPPGAVITRLTLTAQGVPRLSFAGVAPARSSLVVLQDRLGLIEWVQAVAAPDTNLLERDNPAYQFDLTIKPPATP